MREVFTKLPSSKPTSSVPSRGNAVTLLTGGTCFSQDTFSREIGWKNRSFKSRTPSFCGQTTKSFTRTVRSLLCPNGLTGSVKSLAEEQRSHGALAVSTRCELSRQTAYCAAWVFGLVGAGCRSAVQTEYRFLLQFVFAGSKTVNALIQSEEFHFGLELLSRHLSVGRNLTFTPSNDIKKTVSYNKTLEILKKEMGC